ncbi:MAG: hypothetical protein JO107_11860, partial [Hyphomicrobiales bacterium]|nr:hypothetical protein [Hyphomicrobiales bacterium]
MPGVALRREFRVSFLRAAALGVATALMVAPALAQECGDTAAGFDHWLNVFKQQAIGSGVSAGTVD